MLLVWSVLVLLLSAVFGVHGRAVEVNWTPAGVADYRDPSTPLRTELGDTLTLNCEDIASNLFIQTEEIQHNQCNASAGSGIYDYNGFCPPGSSIMLTLTENSQDLMNTVNFVNDRLYYFASYSTGELGDAANEAIKSGGQCYAGLKMVVQIGEIPITPDTGGNRPSDPGDSDGLPIAIIAGAAAGGGAFLITLVAVCIFICVCCCYNIKKGKKGNVETVDAPVDSKSRSIKCSSITPVSSSVHDGAKANPSQINGKSLAVNGKKEGNSTTETSRQGEVPWGRKGPPIGGKKQGGIRTDNNKQSEELTTPKAKRDTTAKTSDRSTTVSTNTTQAAQSGRSKTTINGTNGSTNRTGAASSPSQNKANRGDKTTVRKGTFQSVAKSSDASHSRDKRSAAPSVHRPAPPPPSTAAKHDRVQVRSSLPPSQSLPPSTAATKHERIQVKSSLPPLREKAHGVGRTQKNTNVVSYKTGNSAVKF